MPGGEEPGRFTDVRCVDETGSTNADLLALARAGAPEGVVIVTGYQHRGRGRRGRSWTAPAGSALLASVLLRPPLAPATAQLATVAAALAATDACREVAGVRPALKWPNDLVIDGPDGATVKLAGILAESLVKGERLAAVVVGMGCNLTAAPPGATCLQDLAGRPVDRDELLASWLHHLDQRYPSLSQDDVLLDDYRRHCTTLGRTVRVELGDETLEGVAEEVTREGHLRVHTPAGPREVTAADVHHLRSVARPY